MSVSELDEEDGTVPKGRYTSIDWQKRLNDAFETRQPFIGHSLKPIPLRDSIPRTEKVSTYIELELLRFLEEYGARCGFRSVSEVLRRLIIIGALAEGYQFDESGDDE